MSKTSNKSKLETLKLWIPTLKSKKVKQPPKPKREN